MPRTDRRPPVDRRLFRYSPTARVFVAVTSLAAVMRAATVIVMAVMVASVLGELITEPPARSLDAQAWHLWVLGTAVVIRVAATIAHDHYAHRAADTVITELRTSAVGVLTDPARTSSRALLRRRDRAVTVLTRGLDGLAPYLSSYLPALVLTVVVTPTIIVVLALTDLTSALIVVVTLPLIPAFMILVGLMTRDRTRARMDAMSRLSSQVLDLVAGIPTLRAFGRAAEPAVRIGRLGQSHRRTTMRVLRVAFLSGAVLELLATLCVALVAVSIGLRLVYDDMSLYAGVLALVLAPEVYLPLRAVGAQFHNSQDGLLAADEVFALVEDGIDGAVPLPATRAVTVAGAVIRFRGVGVRGRDGWAPDDLTADCPPGSLTLITGPNGSGKSTVLQVLLGLISPDAGEVRIGDVSVTELDRDALWAQTAWLPQQPVLVPGTVADNLALLGPLDPAAAITASAATGLDTVLGELPAGERTLIGAGGVGISAGQRQRLALTRTLASTAPLVVLDEPTAHLDAESEAAVIRELRSRADDGATVIVVGHRPALLDAADVLVATGEPVEARGVAGVAR
ncbi:thiol reductant ABC exporter subunit CydD [Williamsia sterculiae]|uniref:ATP-binding cassette, subfamily C, CydD n=1 Tax=Williamsia sterculiae TaxID=1344003 RepID=A0A1N7GXA8_9NOCA|nr:thiol reductant ABC exporter subunit CydD [Williamsia sterculiae]SIS17221.1 ATP-binding cassette, subfamily C, CydD [Williamsia sterculiae]